MIKALQMYETEQLQTLLDEYADTLQHEIEAGNDAAAERIEGAMNTLNAEMALREWAENRARLDARELLNIQPHPYG